MYKDQTTRTRSGKNVYPKLIFSFFLTTCVTNKLQMNPVHLLLLLLNIHNWISVNQLFQAQLASSKRMEIWQTLRFTNKLWKEHNFEYGSSAKLFTDYMKVDRSYTLLVYVCRKSLHTHHAIAFIVNSLRAVCHLRLKSAINCTTTL